MKEIVCNLRNLITKAAEQNISRRKSYLRLKVWWNSNLTILRKEMTKQNRTYKRYNQSQQQWKRFTNCRTEYFQAIKRAKQDSWFKFLLEAKGKEVFQAYKYIKSRLMKRISFIKTAEEDLCQDFKSKCYTFIKAMYSKLSEISQDIDTLNTQEDTQRIWHNLSDNEVK